MVDSNSMHPDAKLATILDEIQAKIDNGESVDFETEIERHRDLEDELRKLLPTMVLMQDWAASDALAAGEQNGVSRHTNGLPESATLGDYRVIREVGRGGMGVVYEAQQLSLDRRVALKVLPMAAFLSETQLQRFKQEACAAAALQHSHIVRVHGVGCDRSIHFYAMDFIRGADLAAAIPRIHGSKPRTASREIEKDATVAVAKLSTARRNARSDFFRSIARVGIQAAEALQHAHDHGVIHRDIKPGNLLLDQSGNVHLTDFGLAQTTWGECLTWTGDLVGTIRYMSLEQIEGHEEVDGRTDIYSLGVTLYELLTGTPAYPSESKATLLREITSTSPSHLKKQVSDIPDDLATIVEKAMAKEAADRYQQAQELATDLRSYLESRPIQAKPSTQFDHLRRFGRRNPALSAALVATFVSVALLACVSTALAMSFAAQSKLKSEQIVAAEETARQQREQADRAKETAKRQQIALYARDMQAAGVLAEEKRLVELQEKLLRWVPGEGERDLRGFEWLHLWSYLDNPTLLRAFEHEIPIHDVEFTSDDQIIISTHSNEAEFLSIEDGSHQGYLGMPNQFVSGINVDDGLLCMGDQGGNVCIWNVQEREIEGKFRVYADGGNTDDVKRVELNGDKTLITASGGCWDQGFVRVWARHAEDPTLELTTDSGTNAAFLPNNELLLCQYRKNHIEIYDEDFAAKKRIELGEYSSRIFGISPDGKLLAVATQERLHDDNSWSVQLWQIATWTRLHKLRVTSHPRSFRFTNDGSRLFWGDEEGNISVANIDVAAGSAEVIFRRRIHPSRITSVSLSPSETRLATAGHDGFVYVWDIEALLSAPPAIAEYPGKDFAGNQACAISFSGDRIGLAIRGKGIVDWDTKSGESRIRIPTEKLSENLISLSRVQERNQLVAGFGSWPSPRGKKDRVVIWDIDTEGKREIRVPALGSSISSTAVSSDGKWLAMVVSGERFMLVDLSSEEKYPSGIPAKCLRFASEKDVLAIGDYTGMVRVFDCHTKKVIGETRMDERLVICVDITSDGNLVAAVGFDRRIMLFDVKANKTWVLGEEFPAFPNWVRFTPDGKRIMTASFDGRVRMWITETGDEVMSWKTPSYAWMMADFSPDGSALALNGLNYAAAIRAPSIKDYEGMSESKLRSWACQKVSQIR